MRFSQNYPTKASDSHPFSHRLNRFVLTGLVIVPFAGMLFLTLTVLMPSLKSPEAKFYSSSKGYPAKQRAAGSAIEVETVVVGASDLTQALSAPGESVAIQSVEIRPEVEGVVAAVLVEEGDWVKKGQELVRLDPSSFLDEVKIAENNLANDQRNLENLQAAADNDFSKLTADVEKAEARVANAEALMSSTTQSFQERSQSAIRAAESQLQTAAERLARIRILAESGALSQLDLLQAEDDFAQREHELLLTRQGDLGDNARQYNNRDYVIGRRLQLERSRIALERSLALRPNQLEKSRLRLQTRQAQLREAQRNLARTIVSAPTDGLVSVLAVDEGEVVSNTSDLPMLTLSEDILFEAFVDQAQLNQVAENDIATLRLTAYSGEIFTGRVVRVNPSIETDATQQQKVGTDRQYTYSVWISVEGLKMPPGLQGYAQFRKAETALTIPESSFLHLSNGEGMVMVIEDGRATPRSVQVGPLLDNQRAVTVGLQAGEKVILNPQALEPGDLVTERGPS